MQVNVVGKQIEIGDALRTHVESSLAGGVGKYFDRPGQAQVTFSREGTGFRCDCVVHFDSGIVLQSTGDAADIYASFESASDRMEKRVRRYKRRLKNHHNSHRRQPSPSIAAPTYVIASEADDAEEPESSEPLVIAETTTDVKTLTVGEAVMQMDLADAPALVFRSSAHGGINVVYRRPDGNIGWIDLRH